MDSGCIVFLRPDIPNRRILRSSFESEVFGVRHGQRQTAEFTSTSHTNSPRQGGLVSGALATKIQTLCTKGPPPIAFCAEGSAGETVVRSTTAQCPPPSLPRGGYHRTVWFAGLCPANSRSICPRRQCHGDISGILF